MLPLRECRVQVNVFIDGRLAGERTFPGMLATTTNDVPVTIGASSASGGEAFRGNLDEVMILGRARDKAQVSVLSRRCGEMRSDRQGTRPVSLRGLTARDTSHSLVSVLSVATVRHQQHRFGRPDQTRVVPVGRRRWAGSPTRGDHLSARR